MFIPSDIKSNEIAIYKIIKTSEAKENEPSDDQKDSL